MICIFDAFTEQGKFNTCGERILNPTSAYVIEELNGNYAYELTAPIVPDDDSWKFIKPNNIIKSTRGQLFPIYKIEYDWSGNYPVIKAWGRHIWYYFADKIVFDCVSNGYSGYWAIDNLYNHIDFGRGEHLVDYNFTYGSDISATKYTEFNEVTAANAILGNAESIVNIYDAELYRDNFYFSVNKRKQDAVDLGFSLIHDWNCTGIKHTIDYSDTMTEMLVYDNIGHNIKSSTTTEAKQFPHQVMYVKKLSYDKEREVSYQQFYDDSQQLWEKYNKPLSSYDVNFVDMKNTTREAGWGDLEHMNVGSTGFVTDVIGTSLEQIIYTKYNELTHRMENIKLGTFKQSGLHGTRWDKMVSGDTAAFRRLDLIEQKSSVFRLVED